MRFLSFTMVISVVDDRLTPQLIAMLPMPLSRHPIASTHLHGPDMTGEDGLYSYCGKYCYRMPRQLLANDHSFVIQFQGDDRSIHQTTQKARQHCEQLLLRDLWQPQSNHLMQQTLWHFATSNRSTYSEQKYRTHREYYFVVYCAPLQGAFSIEVALMPFQDADADNQPTPFERVLIPAFVQEKFPF